jgi:hypothetical protein
MRFPPGIFRSASMDPRIAAATVCIALWTATALDGGASSDGAILPVRLTVESSGNCPGREVFLSELQARSARVREARADERAQAMRVELSSSHGQASGRLIFRPLDGPLEGQDLQRDLRGADCRSVLEGLALVAALILDPAAASPEEPEPVAPATGPPDTAAPPPAPPPVLPPEADARRRPSVAIRSSDRTRVSLGAAIEVAAGLGPDPAVMVRAFIDVVLPAPLSTASTRLSLGRSDARSVDTAVGSAQITLTDVRWEPCLDLWSPAMWRVRGCGIVEGGVIDGAGTNTNAPRTASRTLVELGLALRPTLLVRDRLILGFMVGMSVPLARYRFYFSSPDTTVYELSAVSVLGEFSLGVRF